MKKVSFFTNLLTCLCILLSLTSCHPSKKKVVEELLSEGPLKQEHVIRKYEEYLPAKDSYYTENGSYFFTVTYETDSDLIEIGEIEVCNNSKKLYGEMDGYCYSYRYPYKIKFVSEGAQFNVKCTYYDEDHKFKVEVDRVFVILPTEEYLTDHLNKNSGLNRWENKEDKITITQTITNKQTAINAEIISSTSYYGTYTKATGILDMHVVYTITTKYDGQVKNEEKDEYRIKYNKNTDEYYFNEELSTTPINENTIIGKTILAIKGFEQLVK